MVFSTFRRCSKARKRWSSYVVCKLKNAYFFASSSSLIALLTRKLPKFLSRLNEVSGGRGNKNRELKIYDDDVDENAKKQ